MIKNLVTPYFLSFLPKKRYKALKKSFTTEILLCVKIFSIVEFYKYNTFHIWKERKKKPTITNKIKTHAFSLHLASK